MARLDANKNVLEWGSETIKIPYESPVDGKIHLYFVDFYVKIKNEDGEIIKMLIEIKPKSQTVPPRPQARKTKAYVNAVLTWGVNESKWEAAKAYCRERGFQFQIYTETELGIN